MNVYRILMFINNKKISVYEAIDSITLKQIGFHGNDYFVYTKIEDVDIFIEEFIDHYNIDNLHDLKLHIQIIDCHMDKTIKSSLLNKLSECDQLNINHVENVIPAILIQKRISAELENICVLFWDNEFRYSIANNGYTFTYNDTMDYKKISLTFNDFLSLIFWSNNGKHEYDKKLNALNSILEKKDDEIKELTKKINSLSKSLEGFELAKKELADFKETMKNEKIIRKRVLVEAKSLPNDVHYEIFPSSCPLSSSLRKKESPLLIIVEEVNDGDYVSGGHEIAWVKDKQNLKRKTYYTIKAPNSGKIAWLYPNESQIPLKTNNYPVVAVIGAKEDDVEDMRKWYFENFGM